MSRTKGVVTVLAVLCLGVFAFGCGGDDGASQEELDKARAEGAKEAKAEAEAQAKIDELEAEVEELKEQGEDGDDSLAEGSGSATGSARTLEFFSSPTGNIGCSMTDDGARCDISKRSWKPPAKPASCQLDWGQGVQVGGGRATYVCAGDTTLGGSEVLEYGQTSQVGDFTCESSDAGMRCQNATNGHGFELSRESVELF